MENIIVDWIISNVHKREDIWDDPCPSELKKACFDGFLQYWTDQSQLNKRQCLWDNWPQQSLGLLHKIKHWIIIHIDTLTVLLNDSFQITKKQINHTQDGNGGYLNYELEYSFQHENGSGNLILTQTVINDGDFTPRNISLTIIWSVINDDSSSSSDDSEA